MIYLFIFTRFVHSCWLKNISYVDLNLKEANKHNQSVHHQHHGYHGDQDRIRAAAMRGVPPPPMGYAGGAPLPTGAPPQVLALHWHRHIIS